MKILIICLILGAFTIIATTGICVGIYYYFENQRLKKQLKK